MCKDSGANAPAGPPARAPDVEQVDCMPAQQPDSLAWAKDLMAKLRKRCEAGGTDAHEAWEVIVTGLTLGLKYKYDLAAESYASQLLQQALAQWQQAAFAAQQDAQAAHVEVRRAAVNMSALQNEVDELRAQLWLARQAAPAAAADANVAVAQAVQQPSWQAAWTAAQPGGGSLFGGASQQQPGTWAFGASGAQAQGLGGSLFGAEAASPAAPVVGGGVLFGAPSGQAEVAPLLHCAPSPSTINAAAATIVEAGAAAAAAPADETTHAVAAQEAGEVAAITTPPRASDEAAPAASRPASTTSDTTTSIATATSIATTVGSAEVGACGSPAGAAVNAKQNGAASNNGKLGGALQSAARMVFGRLASCRRGRAKSVAPATNSHATAPKSHPLAWHVASHPLAGDCCCVASHALADV